MKKLLVASAVAMMITISAVTAQTTYACFCIQGIIWEKGCPALPTTPTPTTPTKPETPVVPVEKPTIPEVKTPVKPTVVLASATKTTTMATPAELPETGIDSTLATVAGLGIAGYLAAYAYIRLIKR